MPTHDNNEELLEYALEQIKKIQADESKLTLNRINAMKEYDAEPYGNEIEGRSKIVSSDIADTIEWFMPQIMSVVGDVRDIVSVGPEGGPEDEEGARLLQEKTIYDLTKKNNWFLFNYDWIKDSSMFKNGFIKASWKEETEEESYKGVDEMAFIGLQADPDVEILEVKERKDPLSGIILRDIKILKYIGPGYVKVEPVPVEEVGIPINAKNIATAKFVYHRVKREPWEIKDAYGEDKLAELEHTKDDIAPSNTQDIVSQRLRELGGISFLYDKDDGTYVIYECYFRHRKTGVPLIFTISGQTILRIQENNFERPLIFTHTPIRVPHRLFGKSLYDLTRELQKIRTALWRNILDNFYFNNNGRYLLNEERVNLDDFKNNNVPGGLVRSYGENLANNIFPIPHAPFNPLILSILENVEAMKEARTGIPRYNQGTTSRSLHRTFRGTAAILGAFSERIGLVAKLITEGLKELVEFVVSANIKFMRKNQMVRVFNRWVQIDPINFKKNYDISVNVEIGTGSREAVISQMQQLLGLYAQAAKFGVPIITPKNVYNTFKTLLEAMGKKNVDLYITNPEDEQEMQELLVNITQALTQGNTGQALQLMQGLAMRLGINYTPQATQAGEVPPQQPNLPLEPFNPHFMTDKGFENARKNEPSYA